MDCKRLTILAGHYGSGKTNIAVNYAIWLKKNNKNVEIFDMDIVNPYFRTLDGKPLLDKYGIELAVSDFANSNVDTPAMSGRSYAMIHDKSKYAVVDVGGDDRGALALGRFAKEILQENNYEMLYIANKYRFETRTIEGAVAILKEVEEACGLKFTGIVNNSNLGKETTPKNVIESLDFIKNLCKETNLELKFTCCKQDIYEKLKDDIKNLMPIEIIHYGDWC